jgi:hypothetical protein
MNEPTQPAAAPAGVAYPAPQLLPSVYPQGEVPRPLDATAPVVAS